MPARRSIDERVGALERRLAEETEGSDQDPGENEPTDSDELRERIEALESTVAELEAGLQAVRGYVGNVEHVNESVERRADAALAAVERLESAPKTPPPIATASPADTPPAAAAEAEPSADEPETESPDLLERLRSLV